jgi:hypothetical protein
MLKNIHGSWSQYVGPKSCSLQYVIQKNHLMGWCAMVQDLTPQCKGEEFKSPHLQPRLPWLLSDLIR